MPGSDFIISKKYDAIVIGAGSMGSAACYFLAKQGFRVLGIEQFGIGHENGSHGGQSRIIRKAYFEHPDYVPLLQRAYQNWNMLEEETGQQVYYKTGLLYSGNPGHEIIKGVKRSAGRFSIPVEELKPADILDHLPGFSFPPDHEILFEPDAGFITPERSIRLYAEQAKIHGAEIHTNERVLTWKKDGAGITVTTEAGKFRSDKIIFTAGAWTTKLLPALSGKLKVTRQVLAWAKPKDNFNFTLGHFPCWMIADDSYKGCFYGFPVLPGKKFDGPSGLKLAHHYPEELTDPDDVNREITASDLDSLHHCINKYIPGATTQLIAAKTCLYTNSADEHFIIDFLPGHDNKVIIACGFSGHGFKFVSVVGEILADLAIRKKTGLPADFLRISRF